MLPFKNSLVVSPLGYDVIIDQDLKPWLLEVNASPSLTANTKEDYMMKTEMLHGMLDVIDMEASHTALHYTAPQRNRQHSLANTSNQNSRAEFIVDTL